MKITVYGKAHREGVAKKTGNPYNFNQVHYLGKARNVIEQAAMALALDPIDYPIEHGFDHARIKAAVLVPCLLVHVR